MAQIGSFALLLALALSAYSFLAGLLALLRPGAGSERLGETARRAGIAAFAVVLLAAVVLVIAAFQDDFSIAYIFHHSNRDLPAPYKFATLWSGQEGSLLFWSLLLRSEEHTSELQSRLHLVCRLLLEKKKHLEPDTGQRDVTAASKHSSTLPYAPWAVRANIPAAVQTAAVSHSPAPPAVWLC